METNSQQSDTDSDEGSVNGQESTTKEEKKPKGWKYIPKKTGSTMPAIVRRMLTTQNELLKFGNYTGKKIKHFQIIVTYS